MTPLQALQHPLFEQHKLSVLIKRDDLIHPIISGNKLRKLKFNLRHAKQQQLGVLSFGGAYSNHIHALAYACYQQQIPAVGVIRGEPHYANNSTLSQVTQWGMKLHFVDRATYRLRHDEHYLASLSSQFPNYLIVPEGGSNQLALLGVAEVIHELNQQIDYQHIILPVGSGGTIAGLVKADAGQHQIHGIAVLKQADYLNAQIADLAQSNSHNWHLYTEFHQGGYGKFSADYAEQVRQLSWLFKVPFEPIYSGKMLIALMNLIKQGRFTQGETIVLLHTGGLQGLNGLLASSKLASQHWLMPNSDNR